MIVSATLTSAYSVVLIAVDRFLYILHGLQYQRWLYSNRARLLIVITWIIGMQKRARESKLTQICIGII